MHILSNDNAIYIEVISWVDFLSMSEDVISATSEHRELVAGIISSLMDKN